MVLERLTRRKKYAVMWKESYEVPLCKIFLLKRDNTPSCDVCDTVIVRQRDQILAWRPTPRLPASYKQIE